MFPITIIPKNIKIDSCGLSPINSHADLYGETKKFITVRIATISTKKEKPPYAKGEVASGNRTGL